MLQLLSAFDHTFVQCARAHEKEKTCSCYLMMCSGLTSTPLNMTKQFATLLT